MVIKFWKACTERGTMGVVAVDGKINSHNATKPIKGSNSHSQETTISESQEESESH